MTQTEMNACVNEARGGLWQAARNGDKRRQWAAMIYPGEGKKGQPTAGDYVLAAEQTRAEAAASPQQSTEFDLARADRWEGKARTKQLPATRTEIGAGGELIDVENRRDGVGVVDTVADPDFVTASASRERLELANEAGSLDLALDAADTIQGQDSLEKMLVHQMAVLHRGAALSFDHSGLVTKSMRETPLV